VKCCHRCGTRWEGEGQPPFRAVCENCQAYLHSCLNCRFHDEHAHNQCREPASEVVANREGANFCEYFEFVESRTPPTGKRPDDARRKWDALFGD